MSAFTCTDFIPQVIVFWETAEKLKQHYVRWRIKK